ncbi:MAG: glycosyltransferase family 39 protein, partial [Verrucomicrobia bacterium]|nr:glycosyltransferase family 39 protein [Verrucomicrobiota bacterium]
MKTLANPSRSLRIRPVWFLVIATVIYFCSTLIPIAIQTARDSDWQSYFVKDSMHYYVIAQQFAAGNFSMDYLKGWPYRQPLLPACIATILKLTAGNLFADRLFNVLVVGATGFLIYWIIRRLHRDEISAVAVSILFVLSPFAYDHTVHWLVTEPLHLGLMVCAIGILLTYLSKRTLASLVLLTIVLALDYLDRTNGLFLSASAFVVIGASELFRGWRNPEVSLHGAAASAVTRTFLAVTIWAVLTLPSSWPRSFYFHNPI